MTKIRLKRILSLFAAVVILVMSIGTTVNATTSHEDIPAENTEPTDNPLLGKLIFTAGDSITAGAKIHVDIEMGERPTYAALTADRNQAKYLTNAISGTTMGCINANGKEYQGFASTTYKRYKKAPANVDYITLWFGTNDNTLGRLMYKEQWLKKKYGKTIYYPRYDYQIGRKGFATKAQIKACDSVTGYIDGVKYTGNRYFYMKYLGNKKAPIKEPFGALTIMCLTTLLQVPNIKTQK